MFGTIEGLESFKIDSFDGGALPKPLVLKALSEDALLKPIAPIKQYLERVDRISLVKDLVKSGEISEEHSDAIRELVILQAQYELLNQKIEELRIKIDQNDQAAMTDFAKLLLEYKEITDNLILKYKSLMIETGAKIEELQLIVQKIKIISDDTAARIMLAML